MSGGNQHFVPQFLQRGFASHKVGKTAYTWEFKKGSAPINEKIRDIGADYQFYTELGDTAVDDAITKAENRYGNLVNRLRTAAPGPVSDSEIPAFLAHLEIRTRHIRQAFLESGVHLIGILLDLFSNADAFVEIIQRRAANDPTWFRGLFAAEFKALPPERQPADINAAIDLAMVIAQQSMGALLDEAKPQIRAAMMWLKPQLRGKLEMAVKAGHLRALKRSIEPKVRSDTFSRLHFRVVDTVEVNLVLGDSAGIFYSDNLQSFRPYTEKGDQVGATFLPINWGRILVGETVPKTWDYSVIKRQLVRCSFEYFIAHENTSENANLQSEIGLDAFLISKDELETMAIEGFRDLAFPDPSMPN